MTDQSAPVGRLLVVDDERANRRLLRVLLQREGYEVEEEVDGLAVLERDDLCRFHAILLDVMMPHMDGFEVCRHLQAGKETRAVPVLLVTALSGREQRLTGIASGATDFLNKPIDKEEVLLRVRNAVSNKKLYDQVQQSHRLLGDLTDMLVHDLRNPLTSIFGNAQLLELDSRDWDAGSQGYLQELLHMSRFMKDMLNGLLDMRRLEEGTLPVKMEWGDLRTLVDRLRSNFRRQLTGAAITWDCPETLSCRFDESLITRVLGNLVDNALKHTPQGCPVQVTLGQNQDEVQVRIADVGPGVPEEMKEHIFEKFARAPGSEKKRGSIGLGLTFCRLAVESHGGRIGVTNNQPGPGCTFWFTLPAA